MSFDDQQMVSVQVKEKFSVLLFTATCFHVLQLDEPRQLKQTLL